MLLQLVFSSPEANLFCSCSLAVQKANLAKKSLESGGENLGRNVVSLEEAQECLRTSRKLLSPRVFSSPQYSAFKMPHTGGKSHGIRTLKNIV